MLITALSISDLDRKADDIMSIGSEFIVEAKHPFPLNREHFLNFWRALITQDLAKFYVAIEEGKIIGVFGALFFPEPFTGELQATESFWFVTKEHRGGSAGIRLYRTFEAEAKRRNCKTAMMLNIAGLGDEPLEQFYTRQGYTKAEQAFRKGL